MTAQATLFIGVRIGTATIPSKSACIVDRTATSIDAKQWYLLGKHLCIDIRILKLSKLTYNHHIMTPSLQVTRKHPFNVFFINSETFASNFLEHLKEMCHRLHCDACSTCVITHSIKSIVKVRSWTKCVYCKNGTERVLV